MAALMALDDVIKSITPLLAECNFRKRAGQIFTAEIADEVLGWLGLNRASRHRPAGEVEINPVVGVRHQGVERIVAECRGERFHAYQPPTVSTPLGYLLPENSYQAWVFGSDQSTEGVAQEMVRTIEQYGVSFMRSAAALPELCRRLDEGMGFEHQVMYRRPVAWLLVGDPQRARNILDKALAELADRSDVAAEEFRRFGASLQSRLERRASS
ncbi:MAG: hypothetical protein ACRDTF_21815 [Pseudonocardiaceae bacterium]